MKRGIGQGFSDELMNSLVDNEFSAREKAEFMAAVSQDAEASRTLCELQRVKLIMQSAYGDPAFGPTEAPKKVGWAVRYKLVSLLAGLTFAALVLGGSMMLIGSEQRLVLLDPQGHGQRPAIAEDEAVRIVIHVSSPLAGQAGDLLSEIEGLLLDYRHKNEAVRVEVVANGEGLNLLRSGMSTERERLAALSAQFPNLTFVACMNTMERLQVEQGIVVTLVPEAETTASGVAYVVRRQQEGWIYIRV